MSIFPHLRKAPVSEALMYVRLNLPPDYDVSRLRAAGEALSKAFPELEEGRTIEIEIKEGVASFPQGNQGRVIGFRFSNVDQQVQFRVDGVTVNKLRPYTRWEELFDQFRQIWEVYKGAIPEAELTRVGTRYINHIAINLATESLDDYLTAPPRLPEGLSHQLTGFFARTEIGAGDLSANLIQATTRRTDNGSSKVVVDIDAFKQFSPPMNDSCLWDVLPRLRTLKNEIFFSSITQQAIRSYQ